MVAASVPNRSPILSSVSLSPATPQTNATLVVTPSATDADGDAISYNYAWKKNGVALTGETTASLDLSKTGNGDSKDVITATVTAKDSLSSSAPSDASVTIANTAPTLSAAAAYKLDPIVEDDTASNGTPIETILSNAGAGFIFDVDKSDVLGIAIASLSLAPVVSRFEYTLDNGVTWTPLDVTVAQGTRVLAGDGKTRLRLIPPLTLAVTHTSFSTPGTAPREPMEAQCPSPREEDRRL